MADPSSSSSSSAYPVQVRQATSSLCTPPSLLAQFTSPLPSRLYSRQYAALYDFRLRKLRRGRLLAKAKAKWQDTEESTGGQGKPTYTERILEVKRGKVTYITGIVYTEMRLKPDVLQDLTREQYLPPLPPVSSYSDPTTDHIYLEDESGRLRLVGPILSDEAHRGSWITGTVGAFLGTEMETGEFQVQDVCWPGLPERQSGTKGLGASGAGKNKKVKLEEDESARGSRKGGEEDEYVVLLSGLDLGGSSAEGDEGAAAGQEDLGFASNEMRLSLLSEWIGGEIAPQGEDGKTTSRIAGVVIAGNLMAVQKADGSLFYAPDGTTASTGGDSKASLSNKSGKPTAASKASAALNPSPPSVLLSHLLPLSASLPIVLMPGATDPASAALPQQGIHRAVLQGAGRWSGSPDATSKSKDEAENGVKAPREVRGGIELYNNPSWVQFGSKKILATSGQNLDDIMKYIPVRARAEAAGEQPNGSASQDKMDLDSGEAAQEGEGAPSNSANGASRAAGAGESQQEMGEEEEEEDERLTAAGRLLEFGHVAPTAPDTLWCFPFTDRDPFILDTTPDVLVIGNQPNFATKIVHHHGHQGEGEKEATRVILLPRFSKTGEVALLNLRSGAVRRVKVGWAL
ncbi:hypothetical protein BCV69DRAFT_282748 [Microstroma glucosiphilum]|uniref:Uncharacterized protein n=1 Tax=Pseudomicrostroma glucosiphilum TaxID=1684307 RepID=A0A316U5M3_9BASI|nr:hypothetical protein BCV69DRAFT_282748 [Pseudomicrostroma glucosiphilum]PWN20536.1 hypothetical protein BCV69DRAFT_282748 [Pseudomicrostroma glucosiphilum]